MALESQEFILLWSKSNAKVLGFSSLKWLKIPDSGGKLPFPLYLSQFRSPLKTRCNKKKTLFLKERAGKEAYDYHKSYPLQKSSALSATSSSFSNEKDYWASSRSNLWHHLTHSTLVIALRMSSLPLNHSDARNFTTHAHDLLWTREKSKMAGDGDREMVLANFQVNRSFFHISSTSS